MNKEQISNRLIYEKSPYLLQHAYNPIAWQPWDDYAFNRSRKENKPIFLSIGYSTCHWCHIMKRESFEDLEVAELLNAHFIPIKVDREERPDIDQIYMTVCQALTGQGGWPLTIILTPERQPFFAGTYLPKHSRLGRLGLLETLSEAHLLWSTDRDSLIQSSQLVTQEVQFAPQGVATDKTPLEITTRAYNRLKRSFNQEYGGFGSEPKFPSPHNLLFLMRYWKKTGTASAQAMALKTLQAIYRGGINDHIGFGFARYATDHKWLTPHFEKMLCDNAMLAMSFLEAGQAIQERSIQEGINDKSFNNENFYTEEANRIFTYLLRDMAHPEGGFYSAQDAESEDIEGKFYIWLPQEVYDVLGSTDGSLFCRIYDITEKGNFAGQNIPNLIGVDFAGIAKELNIEPKVLAELLENSRQKLFTHREERVHPFKDDKILTSWNGLTIAALARGAAQLGDARLLAAALKGEQFLRNHLYRSDGRLLACYRDGKANLLGYLDDYAYTIWSLLELYRATFFSDYLSRAVDLTFAAKDLFWDIKQGGFFFCGADAEQLIARPKEIYDHALPSGNSVMAVNLMHLASLTGNSALRDLADHQINAFIGLAAAHPENMTYFMNALLLAGGLGSEVVVTGMVEDPQVMDMLHLIRQKCFCPGVSLIYYPEGAGSTEERARVENLAPYIKNMPSIDNKATAYVCRNKICSAPVTATEDLIKLL